MSKKWMTIAGIVALVVVALGAVLFLTSRQTPVQPASNTGVASSTATSGPSSGSSSTGSSSTSGAGAVTSGKQEQGSTPRGSASGTAPSSSKTGGVATNPALSPLRVFPPLPDSHLPAQAANAPAAAGQTLAPLTSAPSDTISALKIGLVPDGAVYNITMRPYGIGPSIALGSRIAIRVDSSTPVRGAPAKPPVANANWLVIVDTTHGGTVTKGGTYTAVLVFRSDGTKMLPIIERVKAAK